ncbi:MAG TPA: hypothetical protein VN919_02420, partial [Xanthobacteraceae bacterium]|nr:hypothetical protein [Xanthobacteraceae bacterium]
RAVVFGSTVTTFSSGAGGVFMLGHSLMMVWAAARIGDPKTKAKTAIGSSWRERNMVSSRRFGVKIFFVSVDERLMHERDFI